MANDSGRHFTGALFIAVGVLLFLRALGILSFSIWDGFQTYWPIGIILVGIALIMRARTAAFIILIITVVVALVGFFPDLEPHDAERVIHRFKQDPRIHNIEVDLSYGPGALTMKMGSAAYHLNAYFKSSDGYQPQVNSIIVGDLERYTIKNDMKNFLESENEWNVDLAPGKDIEMDLDYGATRADIDLRGLSVTRMSIDAGASSTKLIFADAPINLSIDSGVSSWDLAFPEGSSVKITVDGALLGRNFDGFVKKGQVYYSEDYDENDDATILIDIEAGVARFTTEFYK